MGRRIAVCGATTNVGKCNKVFEVKGEGNPAIFICPDCEDRMNKGIAITLHAYTGRTKGNFSNQKS